MTVKALPRDFDLGGGGGRLYHYYRIRVVSALGRFGLGRFGLGRFGPILRWVVSASVGGLIRPWVASALGRFGQSVPKCRLLRTGRQTDR